MSVCVYTYVCVCVFLYVSICVYFFMCVCMFLHVRMHVIMYICMYIFGHRYIFIFICAYMVICLPLLLYGAPVWIEAMKYEYNRRKYIRVQRLMNIRMAKAYRTTSSEALCIVTGMIPIIIKAEAAVKQYNVRKSYEIHSQTIDQEVDYRNWPHPAEVFKIIEGNGCQEQTIHAYTDRSKNERGVGAGVAVFVRN